MSSYIVLRSPFFYGASQKKFLEATNHIVQSTAQNFQKALNCKADLVEIFFNTLGQLAEKRSMLAKAHNTKGSEFFGRPRDQNPLNGVLTVTQLAASHYIEYNDRISCYFLPYANTLDDTAEIFGKIFEEGQCLGNTYSTEISILNQKNAHRWFFSYSCADYQQICQDCEIPADNYRDTSCFSYLIKDLGIRNIWRNKNPELYEKIKISTAMYWSSPQAQPYWLLVARYLQLDGTKIPLSEYLICEPKESNSEISKAKVLVIHPDALLIAPMLAHIAKIFKEALLWKKIEGVHALKSRVALFHYLLAHTMPFERGSAAIAEWLEMSIYRIHGFITNYNSRTFVNLEAITSSLAQFIKDYDTMVECIEMPARETMPLNP